MSAELPDMVVIEDDYQLAAGAPTAPPTITTPDGWIVDAETGEIVGRIDVPSSEARDDAFSEAFDRGYAEWVLEKMAAAEAQMAAHEERLRAVAENIRAQVLVERRRLDWLHGRFDVELERFAVGELAHSKGRTLRLDHGRLSFRRTIGSLKIVDGAAAVAWCEEFAPEAVRVVRSVAISPLKGRSDLPPEAFEATGPEDRFSIETGVRS